LNICTRSIDFDHQPQLLDVGCGTGAFLHYCQKHHLESTGLEPVERARAIATKAHPRVFADIHQLDGRTYDIITLWHVLEHLKDLNQTIDILRHRLKPTGKIFIAVPNYLAYDASFYQQKWAAYDVPRHLWHFNEHSMKLLMTNHHLKVTDIRPMYLDSFYVSLLSERIQNSQRLGLAGFLRGIWTGAVSNLAATRTNNYSSLIYRVEP
jgi:SAM-dependent methyltransferase